MARICLSHNGLGRYQNRFRIMIVGIAGGLTAKNMGRAWRINRITKSILDNGSMLFVILYFAVQSKVV